MKAEELFKEIEYRLDDAYDFDRARDDILELIEQFKSKWEAEAYIRGFKDACNKTEKYLNEPI